MPIIVDGTTLVPAGELRQVTVAGMVFLGQYVPDWRDRWVVEKFPDWDDQPDAQGGPVERALSHGSFAPAYSLRSSLVATMHVWYRATTQAKLQAARRQLKAVGATAGVVRVVMEREGETRWRDGQIKRIDLTDDRARMMVRAAIDFVFPDPRLYGVTAPESKSGVFPWIALDNTLGSAPSVPRVTVVPAAQVSRIRLYQGSGAYLQVQPDVPIPAGASVEFLADEGVVLVGGVFASGVSGSWPTVAAGASIDVGADADGVAVDMTVDFSPAWW